MNKNKNNELLIVQETPSSGHITVKPKPFKRKFNDRFKMNNICFQEPQENAIKCFKCKKITFKGRNYNIRENRQHNNRDIVSVISECLFAYQVLSGWQVDFGDTDI